jgi:SPX domain protein involved in polyphosphate accumulation
MGEDKMQQQRLELKYRISEHKAEQIRDYIRCYLEPDEFAATRPDFTYPVHSLYLDSDDLKLYWETINGTKNRFKLRIRYYDDHPDHPVFFEIKRRMNNCILKQRGGVKREAVNMLLAGHLPEGGHLTSQNPKSLVALQRFCHKMSGLHAGPKAHIYYHREAWMSPHDNSVRVTFDREICCERDFSTRLPATVENPVFPFRPEVILELKFTVKGQKQTLWDWEDPIQLNMNGKQNYPPWFEDMTQTFDLVQMGVAKYVEGVAATGEFFFEDQRLDLAMAAFDQEVEAFRCQLFNEED